jgi:hypothetical protein
MYGPPRGCKGKAEEEEKSAQMYRPLVEISSTGLDELRACLPSKSVGCSFETILVTRLETRRCDCSFVLAVPVQTSVGKFQAVAVVR